MWVGCLVPNSSLLLHRESLSTSWRGQLFVEFKGDPALDLYLVSGVSSLLWVPVNRYGNVRAGFMQLQFPSLDISVLNAVVVANQTFGWGSVLPHTMEGLGQGIQYITSYCMAADLELLSRQEWDGCQTTIAPWLPVGCSVLIPKDRRLLGTCVSGSDGVGYVIAPFVSRHLVVLKNDIDVAI